MTTTCFGLYWPSSGCLRGSKDLTIGMHAHVVFDYIQFSKFHTHNGDDTLPRLMVFGRGGVVRFLRRRCISYNRASEAFLKITVLTYML